MSEQRPRLRVLVVDDELKNAELVAAELRDAGFAASHVGSGAEAVARLESGGVDALVFTAGIGERSVDIRRRICEASAWLGLTLDPAANAAHGPRISTPNSHVSAWVIPTNEELMIARHTAALLGIAGRGRGTAHKTGV